jgi:hypothetical protein
MSEKLIFTWDEGRRRWGSLLFWLMVVTLALGTFFMVMKVQTDLLTRKPAASHRVMLLMPDGKGAEPLLERAADQSFLALGTGLANQLEQGDPFPKLKPSFSERRLGLRTRPEDQASPRAYPQIVSVLDTLPPPPPAPLLATPNKPRRTSGPLQWQAGSELAQRSILKRGALPQDIDAAAAELRYQVYVEPQGRVLFALPIQEETQVPASVLSSLRSSISALRFSPASEASWGILSLAPASTSP